MKSQNSLIISRVIPSKQKKQKGRKKKNTNGTQIFVLKVFQKKKNCGIFSIHIGKFSTNFREKSLENFNYFYEWKMINWLIYHFPIFTINKLLKAITIVLLEKKNLVYLDKRNSKYFIDGIRGQTDVREENSLVLENYP